MITNSLAHPELVFSVYDESFLVYEIQEWATSMGIDLDMDYEYEGSCPDSFRISQFNLLFKTAADFLRYSDKVLEQVRTRRHEENMKQMDRQEYRDRGWPFPDYLK